MKNLTSLIAASCLLVSCSIFNKSYVYPLGEKREFKKEILMPELNGHEAVQHSLIFTDEGKIYIELLFNKGDSGRFKASYRVCDGGKLEKFPIAVYDVGKNILYINGKNVDGVAERAMENLKTPEDALNQVYLKTRRCPSLLY